MMGLAIKPIECHGGCLGCYEKQLRESGNAPRFDFERVMATLLREMDKDTKREWRVPNLHGGEPTMLRIEEIRSILCEVFRRYERSSIQTCGAFITKEHIEAFKEFNTSVGISIDGDTAELNAGRWNALGFDVQAMTEKTLDALAALKDAGIEVSVISLLRRCNAGTPARQVALIAFAHRLHNEYDIKSIRFNPCVAFDERTRMEEELDNETLADVFRRLMREAYAHNLPWYPMLDFIKKLNGENAVCYLSGCDIWATDSEVPILGDGSLSNCLRLSDGASVLRVERSTARAEMLPQVAQEFGGCKGCFWWSYCNGGCPGAGLGGDWRNRTRFCQAYKETFEFAAGLAAFQPKAKSIASCGGHGDRQHGDSDDPAWRAANPWWKGKHK